MLISTETGAAQIVSTTDDTRFYDDLGCLAADWSAHRGEARPFVRTAEGPWIAAEAASNAQPAGARTAMGSGIAAYQDAAAARAVDRAGRVLTFDAMIQLAGARR